uniref:Transmembrane protein 11 homolog, mitochondrial n=1 Tax=Strigamia maritima TaxID=126957 RepID=T1ITV1_STRMM
MAGFGDSEFNDTVIIREIYDGENSQEKFENELERALETCCPTIVIEPSKLGDDTSRWIAIGNCLHKTAVLSGFGSLVTGLIWPDRPYIYCPMGAVSLFCTGLYSVSWQFDPCCKYQVLRDAQKLERFQQRLNSLTSSSPVVLLRHDDRRRKLLHSIVTVLSIAYCTWRLTQLYPYLKYI